MELMSWAVEEMGYVPSTKESLESLNVGDVAKHWDFIIRHVKTRAKVEEIRKNLDLYRYHLRKSRDQTASTIDIEDQTLSERDMMIKELKEVNHAIKKCLEKSKKVEDQIKENLEECRSIEKSLTVENDRNQSMITSSCFNDRLIKYGDGRIKKINDAVDDLTSKSEEMISTSNQVPAKNLGRIQEFLLQSLIAKNPRPIPEIESGDAKAVNQHLIDHFGDQGRKIRAKTLEIKKKAVGGNSSDVIIEKWRRDHVDRRTEIEKIKKEVEVEKVKAKAKGQKATGLFVDQELVMKWLAVNEKKGRLSSALKEMHKNVSQEQESKTDVREDKETLGKIEMLMFEKQKSIDLLILKNQNFSPRLCQFESKMVELASKTLSVADDIAARLVAGRKDDLFKKRLGNFVIAPQVGLGVEILEDMSDNSAMKLQEVCNLKVRVFDLKCSVPDSIDSSTVNDFKILLERAKKKYNPDEISRLNSVLVAIRDLEDRLEL